MRMIRGFGEMPDSVRATVIAMGNFDGVHLGHRAIFRRLTDAARDKGVPSCALTFFPHPLKVLRPDVAPTMIQSLEDRLAHIEEAGVDYLVVVPFTLDLAGVSADDFVVDYLLRRLRCSSLFVGNDARFGRDREGDVALLRRYSDEGEFELNLVNAVEIEGDRVSSSKIRRFITAGEMESAERMIGRPFSICGEVVSGEGRGATLGFPTANVLADGETRPRQGVYACRTEVDGEALAAAVHLGPIPTFASDRPVLEAHLLDFKGELVGRRLRIDFVRFLREIRKFDDAEDLKDQIARDVEETGKIAGIR